MTVTETLALPRAPLGSTTDAVTRCAPAESPLVVISRPTPRSPSASETQTMPAERSPESSAAVAVKVTGSPRARAAPGAGATMLTSGAWVGGPAAMTTTTESLPVSLRLSVAWAVIRWTPRDRRVAVTVAPVPIAPSRLELQWRFAPRSPSPASVAEPRNVIGVHTGAVVPFAGASTVTVGGVLPATIVTL